MWLICGQFSLKEEGRTAQSKVKHSKCSPVTNPDSSKSLRIPDLWNSVREIGEFVSLTHQPPLPSGNISSIHLCWSLIRSQGQSTAGRNM